MCGVGKNGLIAAKISATLSSVGTPSFNLSAGDSSHGDLGSISKKDVLILISYSGVSEELKNVTLIAQNKDISSFNYMDMHMHGVDFPEAVIELVKEGTLPSLITSSGELQAERSLNVNPFRQGIIEEI